jgi:hypothetical protein
MTTPSPENADYEYSLQIATLAYIYGYAPVTQQVLMAQDLIDRAPMNTMYYSESPSSASNQIFSGSNVDTLYATAWLDLTNTPVLLETPDTKNKDLWYTVQLLDMYTNTIENVPGLDKKKKKHTYLIIGPNNTIEEMNAHPNVSYGIKIIQAPTNIVYLVSRVEIANHDIDSASQVLHEIKVKPLFRDAEVLNIDPYNFDIYTSIYFYGALMSLMNYNPPSANEAPLVNLFKSIGLDPAIPFDPETLSTETQQALDNAVPLALEQIVPYGYLYSNNLVLINNWLAGTEFGSYNFDYMRRDFVAFGGSAGNVPIEQYYLTTIQDGTNAYFDGSLHNYKIHFDADGSNYPKTNENGFWSITLYVNNGELVYGFNLELYDNVDNKYALGTNNNDLIFNGDWSLDLFIQHTAPLSPEEQANWLPCPDGPFRLIFRTYSATVDEIYFPNIPAVIVNDPI